MNTLQTIQVNTAVAALYWAERSAFDEAYMAAQRVQDLPHTASLKMGRTTRAWASQKRKQWLEAKAQLRVAVGTML